MTDFSETPTCNTLTCETEECENKGIPLCFPHDPEFSGAICGPCGRAITNTTDTNHPEHILE